MEEKNKKSYNDRKNSKTSKVNKAVFKISLDGKTIINEFHSMAEAERQTGISHQSISMVCRGKLKTAGGFRWKNITLIES